VPSAWRMSCLTRPSVVSSPARVTSTSTEPVRLCVPAKTSSPGILSAGMDSPVMVASLMVVCPLIMRPSAGTRSPGLRRTRWPGRSSETSTTSPLTSSALFGWNCMSLSTDSLAPTAVCSSMRLASNMKNATIPATL